MMHLDRKIGIDIGSRNVRAVLAGKNQYICEPSVFALEIVDGKILAFGSEAMKLAARVPGSMQLIRPFAGDITPDKYFVDYIIRYMAEKLCEGRMLSAEYAISFSGVPDKTMESYCVEAGYNAGGKSVYLVDTLFAAAVGSRANIQSDIVMINSGASVTDLGVYSHGELACARTITMAGNAFDDAIVSYMLENHKLHVTKEEAEKIKVNVGTLSDITDGLSEDRTYETIGIHRYSGVPRKVVVKGSEFTGIFQEMTEEIVDSVFSMFYDIPFEVASIAVSGGTARLPGLETHLSKQINLPAETAADPEMSVISGLDMLLSRDKLDGFIPDGKKAKK